MSNFTSIDDRELAQIDGGVAPLVAWAIIGGYAFCAGYALGESIGHSLNRD
jgi:lactobin A/cerein 7B family class IIb bacteriocin